MKDNIQRICYRPQGKDMFSVAFVSHSVYLGGGGQTPLDADPTLDADPPKGPRRQTPPMQPLSSVIYWRPLQRSVRILLECILVHLVCFYADDLYTLVWYILGLHGRTCRQAIHPRGDIPLPTSVLKRLSHDKPIQCKNT